MKRTILLLILTLAFNSHYAQKALKIEKEDGSITYINVKAATKITFDDTLAIGDTHQGGIIFYLDASGEHGLVTAPSEQSSGIIWNDSDSYPITGAYGDGIGAGEANTYKIVGRLGSENNAAKLCADLILGVYTDWYLPSSNELSLMYTNLHQASLGNFANESYWSSTEYEIDKLYAREVDFSHSKWGSWNTKYRELYVRAVRAF